MGSITVTFVQVDGVEKQVANIAAGEPLMQAARANGVEGILGDCGGGCACATCHVYVDEQWLAKVGPPDDVESGALDMVSDVQQNNSRLSCQIVARPELDGLRVTVAPMTK
jgi:2Fe-2S ferredoxin